MRKILIAIMLALVVGMTLATMANSPDFVVKAQTPTQVKIMPLGDSITVGYPGVEGYRKDLYLDLINSGFNVSFVGSQKNGTGFDNDNEGHIAYQANDIRDNVYGWLVSNPADVVLLHIGTNDIQSGQDVAGIVSEVNDTLNNIDQWESVYGQFVTVILARIILRSDSVSWNTTTKVYDDALEAMALARIASGDHIIIVDMENALSYPNDLLQDGIHPTPAGYEKMADVWYNALIKILGYKLTVTANFGTTTPSVGEYWYAAGSTVTIAAYSPTNGSDDRYNWIGWNGSGSGSYSGINNTASITLNGPVTETASWTHQWNVTFQQSGLSSDASGTVLTVDASTYTYAQLPTNIWVNDGTTYLFTGTVSAGSGKQYVSTNVTIHSSGTVVGNYNTQYQLTMATNFGSVSPATGNWYNAGSSVTIYAVSPSVGAGERHVWNGWTGSGSGSYTGTGNNTNLVTMNGPVTETASWTHQYQLTFSQSGLDATTASGTILTVNGTNVAYSGLPYTVWVNSSDRLVYTYNATIASTTVGKQFIVGTVSPVSPLVGISSAQTVTGSYTTQYQLTMVTNFGTTTPVGGSTWYNAGSTVTISAAAPNAGAGEQIVWNGWTGSGSGSYTGTGNNTNLVTMNEPITETASWKFEYELTISTNLGTTEPSVGDYWYEAGTSVNVESSPPPTETGVQYVCSGWSGTGSVPASGNASAVTFTINAPSNITWTWKTQYYLTVSSAYGSVGGAGWYYAGISAYATITPTTVSGTAGTQYVFTGWSGGASGSSSTSNAIVMDGPKTATANWSATPTTTPTPTPTATPVPVTPSPTVSPSPSPSPTDSSSSSPSQSPSGVNTSATYVKALAVGVVVIGVMFAGATAGVIAFRRRKK